MKKITVIACSILMAVTASAQSSERKSITLTEAEQKLVEQNNDFAFRLFRQARGEESSIMSPLSITYALGMMNNGAAGQTQQEICDVLGFGQAGADGINAFCRKMLTEAPTLDEETTAEIANTIYVNSATGYDLQQGFKDKARDYYDATPEALDFYDDTTIDIINRWGNDHTHGMIPKVLDKNTFNSDAASYLLNAIYFKGVWSRKFDKELTREENFGSTGSTEPMMRQWSVFDYTENDLYQAVRLPYGNEAYLMTLFLPREGKTIGDVLATMDGSNWQFNHSGNYHVDLKMPRFKTETSINLVKVMSDLGMPTAFTGAAEFPYFGNRDVFIGNMFQKAVIDLDEEGTKAAAITVIEGTESGMDGEKPVTLHADRPFFYVISERSTGAIFFIGQFTGQTPTGIKAIGQSDNFLDQPGAERVQPGNCYDLSGRKLSNGKWSNGQMAKGLYIIDGKKVVVR